MLFIVLIFSCIKKCTHGPYIPDPVPRSTTHYCWDLIPPRIKVR